jgi:hypothetical protein
VKEKLMNIENLASARLSQSESKATEIRQRLDDEVLPAIQAVEAELSALERTAPDWREVVGSSAAVVRVEDERQRLVYRRRLLVDAKTEAEAELAVAQAELAAAPLRELRDEIQRIGEQRTQLARDMIAAAKQLGAMVTEAEALREQMYGVAQRSRKHFVGRPGDAVDAGRQAAAHSDMLLGLKSTPVQTAIEYALAMSAPRHVWESEFLTSHGVLPDAVEKLGTQCRYALLSLDACMRKLIADAAAPAKDS